VHWIAESLRQHPELAVFLTLGVGQAIGQVRLGPVRLNAVIGVLVAGVGIGQIGLEVPSSLQWAFFVLFLFAIGYQTGPQFFRGLGRSALPQVALSLLLCVTALACALAVSRLLGFDAGSAAGLFAGAMNASAAIGTGGAAIANLPLDAPLRESLATQLTVAFAVTYLVGLVGAIAAVTKLGPALMRVDLAAECRKLEAEMGVSQAEFGVVSAYREHAMRAYRVGPEVSGWTVAQLERAFAPARVFVERIRTGGELREPSPGLSLRADDVVALAGRSESLVAAGNPLREREVDDAELLDVPTVAVDVVASRPEVTGRRLGEIAEMLGKEGVGRSVFVRKLARGGQPLPVGVGTVVERGDVVTLVGARAEVGRIGERIGRAQWPSPATDMVVIGVFVAIGGLVGLPAVHVAGMDIGLSMPVGVLLGGLLAGWLRSIRPGFAQVPEPALWLLDSLGLTGFLACVGLGAGPGFVSGLVTSGVALVPAAAVVCLVPNVVTILVGHFVFRMHPGVLLGVCAGAGTAPAALAALQAEAKSRVPTLGYGVSYAVGNVLLALWGSVIVGLCAR
jgi:putative transport protein